MLLTNQVNKLLAALYKRHGKLKRSQLKASKRSNYDALEILAHEYAHVLAFKCGDLETMKGLSYNTMSDTIFDKIYAMTRKAQCRNEILAHAIVYNTFRGWIPGCTLQYHIDSCDYALNDGLLVPRKTCGDLLRSAIREPRVRKLAKQLRSELKSVM